MEDRELPLTPLTVCQNPFCALEKRVLEDMVQTKRIECRGSCAMELKQLKEEMVQLTRDMRDLVAKKREKDQLIVISPSYSVRSMSVDKEGAYRTLVDKTRIMEEQLMDIIRSLEETDTPDRNRLAPPEVGKKKQMEEQNQLAECPSSVGKERNVPGMQESEGQLGTREQQHVAEMPRVVLDEFPVAVMGNENIKAGLVREVTEQENQEQLQSSEIQKQKHIEVVSDTVELACDCGTGKEQALEHIELPNSEKPPREDLQMQESEGQLGTREQQRVAETPRAALDEFHVTVMENENIKAGLVREVTEQENQEQLQSSEIQKQKHIEVVSDTVELARDCGTGKEQALEHIELPNSEKPPREDLQMQESEGQLGTREQQRVAETPRAALDEFHVTVMENENIKAGLVPEVTEQENQEQLQPSGIQEQKHIEVVSDTVELARDCGTEEQALEHIEIPNSEKPPREDLQVEQLEHVEIPNLGKSMQRDIQVEQPLGGVEFLNSDNSVQQDLEMGQPLDGAEFPNSDKSPQQDLQIEQLESVELSNPDKSPLPDLHMEDTVSNPICVPMNMECSLDFQHLGPYNSELSLDHIESTIGIEMTPTDVPNGSEIDPQEQADQLSGETEAHLYQSGGQQSDDRIQGQLTEVEMLRPELPYPGQPKEVRIAKMVEAIVLQQQQQNARSGSGHHELIPFHPIDLTAFSSQKSSRPQRQRRPPPVTYPYTEHRSPKQPRTKKAASIGTPDSDGALDVMPLNVRYYREEQQPSEYRSPRKQSKRKLDYSSTPPKQKGRPRSSSNPKKKQQPKRRKPDSDTNVKTPSDEGEASQRSTASLMSQDEQQASKTPAREMPENEMPDSKAAVEIPSPSDDQQQQGSKKAARLNASVVKEWLARQGLLDGRKRPGQV